MNNDLPPALIPARKETGIKESTFIGLIVMQHRYQLCDVELMIDRDVAEKRYENKVGMSSY